MEFLFDDGEGAEKQVVDVGEDGGASRGDAVLGEQEEELGLRDEVIGFQGYNSAEEAYAAIEEFQKTCFPKHEISADWIECAVVDEFGYLLGKPPAKAESREE